MWIPTHYVVLFVAILLLESAALFVYTLIGLLKQNPLPWIMPPTQPDHSLCQYSHQGRGQIVRGGPQPQDNNGEILQLNSIQSSVAIVTSTSIILQTSIMPAGQISGGTVAASSQATTQTTTTAPGATAPSPLSVSSSMVTVTVSPNTASAVGALFSNIVAPKSSADNGSGAPAPTGSSSGASPQGTSNPSSSGTAPHSGSSPSSENTSANAPNPTSSVITRMATLTSIVPASSVPPQSTSTKVVVVSAPQAP